MNLMGYRAKSLEDLSETFISKKSKVILNALMSDSSVELTELYEENKESDLWYIDHKDGTHVGIFKSNDPICSLYQNELFNKTPLKIGK